MDVRQGWIRRRAVLCLFAAICLVTACSGRRAAPLPGSPDEDVPVRLTVRNDNFLDMVVYAEAGGQRLRIGDVVGKRTRRFELPKTLPGGAQGLRFRVEPIGSDDFYRSDEVYPPPGGIIVLTVSPTLSMSSIAIR